MDQVVVYKYNEVLFGQIKTEEILPFVTTEMDFKDTMLSEIRRTEKNKYSMWNLKTKQTKKPNQTHRTR